jgi:hypothetical protein
MKDEAYNIPQWRYLPQTPLFSCNGRVGEDLTLSTTKANIRVIAKSCIGDLEMREYDILLGTGTCRKLVAKAIARALIELMFQWD